MKPVVPFAAAFLLGGAVLAQEPSAPPVGPDLAPARVVEPRADELVRKMSDLLASSKAFALEADEVYDEVPDDLPRLQLTSRRHVALRRPDRLAGTAAGDAVNRSAWYDGHTVSGARRRAERLPPHRRAPDHRRAPSTRPWTGPGW